MSMSKWQVWHGKSTHHGGWKWPPWLKCAVILLLYTSKKSNSGEVRVQCTGNLVSRWKWYENFSCKAHLWYRSRIRQFFSISRCGVKYGSLDRGRLGTRLCTYMRCSVSVNVTLFYRITFVCNVAWRLTTANAV